HAFLGTSAAHGAKHEVADLHVRNERIRSGTAYVRLRRTANGSAHAARGDRGRGQAGNRRSRRAGERATDWTLAGHALAERARPPRRSFRLVAADRPGCAPWLGAITRTVHGPTRVHHWIHDPDAVFLVSGRRIAGA